MKKVLSAIIAVILCVSFCLLAASCTSSGTKKYSIGIVQIVQHEALDAATEGFKKALTDKLGADNVTFDYQNASGDTANCTTIVNGFVATRSTL